MTVSSLTLYLYRVIFSGPGEVVPCALLSHVFQRTCAFSTAACSEDFPGSFSFHHLILQCRP